MESGRVPKAVAVTCLLLIALLAGCATAEPAADNGAEATGGGMGAEAEGGGMPAGGIAAGKNASLTLGPNASTAQGVRVKTLLAPADGWVVVRSASAPQSVLGKKRVPKGPSRDILVKLDAAEGADVRVAFHADEGIRGEFEFDPERPELSLDKPVVVDGKPLEARLTLDNYGVEAVANSVLILVENQSVRGGTLTIRYLLLPAPAWISVNLIENGLPGRQVGLILRPSGESQQVIVPVKGVDSGQLVVTVFADAGRIGAFEFSIADPLGSTDQPFKSAGVVVSQRIDVN
jgi:hypothetical protein